MENCHRTTEEPEIPTTVIYRKAKTQSSKSFLIDALLSKNEDIVDENQNLECKRCEKSGKIRKVHSEKLKFSFLQQCICLAIHLDKLRLTHKSRPRVQQLLSAPRVSVLPTIQISHELLHPTPPLPALRTVPALETLLSANCRV
jgi:hypothetical protein